MAIFGFSALMESMHESVNQEAKSEEMFELFEASVPDDIKSEITDGEISDVPEDSVEDDMDGNGIGSDEEKTIAKLISKIPPDDEGLSDDIDSLVDEAMESVMIEEGLL